MYDILHWALLWYHSLIEESLAYLWCFWLNISYSILQCSFFLIEYYFYVMSWTHLNLVVILLIKQYFIEPDALVVHICDVVCTYFHATHLLTFLIYIWCPLFNIVCSWLHMDLMSLADRTLTYLWCSLGSFYMSDQQMKNLIWNFMSQTFVIFGIFVYFKNTKFKVIFS